MNKSELISAVAAETGYTKAATTELVSSVLDTVSETLANGESVALGGFGTFVVNEQAARKGRNPRTGETIELPAVKLAKFRPSQKLKDLVRGN